MDQTPPSEVLQGLYDEAALMTLDGGMKWSEYWSTPRSRLNQYKLALVRRQEAIDRRIKANRGTRG